MRHLPMIYLTSPWIATRARTPLWFLEPQHWSGTLLSISKVAAFKGLFTLVVGAKTPSRAALLLSQPLIRLAASARSVHMLQSFSSRLLLAASIALAKLILFK